MLLTSWTLVSFCLGALAAPTATSSEAATATAAGMTMASLVSQYFKLVDSDYAGPAGLSKAVVPSCNLDNAVLPVASPTPLPPVTPGLRLKHVAVGRGTQNYTCGNETAIPAAVGAVATLFNASCLASTSPDILAVIPSVALQFALVNHTDPLMPTSLLYSGDHFFSNTTTPVFNLNTEKQQLGVAPCAKDSAQPAPSTAVRGQWSVGDGAVPWLKLNVRDGATGQLREVYRINTAGGNPPASCRGMDKTFEVQYAAEYWFYESV